ncbi:MAG: queuosine salvage family protein [bacterium]
MNPILESIKPVVEKSRYVKIKEEKIREICLGFGQRDVKYWMDESGFNLSKLNDQERLNFIFVFNSINFCYWGDPKWTIEYKGRQYDGAWGMLAAIIRAVENGILILEAEYLSNLSPEDLAKILEGNITIPLFSERLRILRENGNILLQKYHGQFSKVIEGAGKDTLKLLELLTVDFPSLNDYGTYDGQRVLFHKRAQLAVSDVYRTFKGQGLGELKQVVQLTAFADYKIPQSLRKLGILEYAPELSTKIDNRIQLPESSPEEVEIRANTIWAIELMKRELETKIPQITSMDIDSYLWLLGQKKSSEDKPYHLTKTIFY